MGPVPPVVLGFGGASSVPQHNHRVGEGTKTLMWPLTLSQLTSPETCNQSSAS